MDRDILLSPECVPLHEVGLGADVMARRSCFLYPKSTKSRIQSVFLTYHNNVGNNGSTLSFLLGTQLDRGSAEVRGHRVECTDELLDLSLGVFACCRNFV